MARTPMVKIGPETHRELQEISRDESKPMGEIITYLVDRYQRERFWRGAAEDIARLKEEPAAWDSYRSELDDWDATVADGLDREPTE